MRKIGFTTSRSPAKKTRSFVHDIIRVVPNAQRIVRGSSKLLLCLKGMQNRGFNTAVVIHSVKGNPNFLRIFDLEKEPIEIPYAIKIRGLTLSRDYQKKQSYRRISSSILISSLNNTEEEAIIKRVLGIAEENIEDLEEKNYVTVYVDYLDKDEGIIHVEFLDKNNSQIGPRVKMKIVPRKPEDLIN
jgi:rRNA maturation protein Rpf1